jgi:hypothetical protein
MKVYCVIFAVFLVPILARAENKGCLLSGIQLDSYLKLDYKSFDQALPDGGWRGLSNKGCELEAIKLVEIYHLHHLDDLNESQAQILYWHAGQVYGMQNLNDLAISRFKKSYNPKEKSDDPFKWNSYVDATIAFFEHDLPKLKQARQSLATATASGAANNLKIVDAFIRCIGKPYSVAYNPNCK